MTKTKTDKQIKTEATQNMYVRVFDNMILDREDIEADCSDGRWVRKYWDTPNRYFGWGRWQKI